MSTNKIVDNRGEIVFPDPPIARALLGSTRWAWLWLILRVYLGWAWLSSGWGKYAGGKWAAGEGLKGFWTNAVVIPETGRPSVAYDWYRTFLQFMLDREWYTWFADLVMYGEIIVGILLIIGAFTGIAALLGGFMNWNFIMAGAASSNGMLLVLAVLIVLAWKVAGWYGLDRWLLPAVGVPWTWSTPSTTPAALPAASRAR